MALTIALPIIVSGAAWEPFGESIQTSYAITSMDTSDNGDHLAMVDASGAVYYMNITSSSSTTNTTNWQSQLLVESDAKCVVISHDGNTIVIGVPSSNTVYVYTHTLFEQVWEWVAKQVIAMEFASTAEIDDQFGYSLAISGDGTVVAVSAPYNDDQANDAGVVKTYIYDNNSELFTLHGQVSSKLNIPQQKFGSSLALNYDGTRLAISAIEDYTLSQTGLLWLYGWDFGDGVWSKLGSEIPGPSTTETLFGWTVDMSNSGDIVAISAPYFDSSKGAVMTYEYESSGGNYIQLGNSIIGYFENDQVGYSISLSSSGDRLAIGAIGVSNAYVYQYNDNTSTWEQEKAYRHETLEDELGGSIVISGNGDNAVIGASTYMKKIVYDVNLSNVAFDKATTQSSLAYGGEASRAVDKRVDGRYWADTCTHTNYLSNSWWMVDLEGTYIFLFDLSIIYYVFLVVCNSFFML